MGPAHGRAPRDARRRSRCGSLQRSPWVAFRPPPLTPAPPAERLRSMASRSRHRSAVVAGRGLSRRVAERRRATLPRVASPRRRLSRRSPARARVAPGKWLAPCGQDMDSVARNHLARLRRGGEPPRGRSRQRAKERAGTPVASRPQELSRRARSDSPAPFAQAPRTPASPSLSRAA